MEIYQLQTMFLKLLAVLFILVILTSNSKRNLLTSIIVVAIMSISVHTFRDGINGLYFSVSGIVISFFLTIPIHFNRKTTKSRFVYSTVAGAITGPLGSILVFTILFFFLALSRLFKSQQLVFSNIQQMMVPIQPTSLGEENLKSQLARIEANRMNEENNYGNSSQSLETERKSPQLRTGPWKTILAMSTLAVIITGMFI
ncbi:hypothetical protein J7M07_05040 [bacterium]|nr:hypothetical protein [bacterium]